jgi:hypothetical protein
LETLYFVGYLKFFPPSKQFEKMLKEIKKDWLSNFISRKWNFIFHNRISCEFEQPFQGQDRFVDILHHLLQ